MLIKPVRQKTMRYSDKARITLAISVAAPLVLIAFALRDIAFPFYLLLLPGVMVNMFTRGVHGNWDTGIGMACMIIPSFIVWSVLLYTLTIIVAPESQSKDTERK